MAKHAHASSAEVRIDQRDDDLWLQISDDGIGGADPGSGSGLVGLRDRAAAGGGTMTLESRPGQGTRLTVTLPFHAPAPAVST
jgi:signal transduction histidine kinase